MEIVLPVKALITPYGVQNIEVEKRAVKQRKRVMDTG
jgi:hypothetical protein